MNNRAQLETDETSGDDERHAGYTEGATGNGSRGRLDDTTESDTSETVDPRGVVTQARSELSDHRPNLRYMRPQAGYWRSCIVILRLYKVV